MTSSIEIRPFSGFDAIGGALDQCVLIVDGDSESRERRVEAGRNALASAKTLRISLTPGFLELAKGVDRTLESVALQAYVFMKTTRRTFALVRPVPLANIDGESVEVEVPGDANGQDLIVELSLLGEIGSDATGIKPPKHALVARSVTSFVNEREPNTFPRKALNAEARDYLNSIGCAVMPGTMHFVEFKQELLGEGFAESLTIWIDEKIGPQLEEKSDSEAAMSVNKSIAIDVAISIGNQAWDEASAGGTSKDTARGRFAEGLDCTNWLAQKHREAFGGRLSKDSSARQRAADFAEACSSRPELVRARLQHAWKVLSTTERLLVEANR